jgi:hypothetical protein
MYVCMYLYVYVDIYIHMYIYRERARKSWEEGVEAENLLMDKVK